VPDQEALLERLRAICLSLPEATEGAGVGNPSFRVRDKIFAMRHDRHDGRWSAWCKAPPGAQHALVQADPERCFVPPFVGIHGWIGISFEVDPDWDFVAELIEQSYRMTAPRKLIGRMEDGNR